MLQRIIRRLPGAMALLRRLQPHKFVAEREGELFGLFNLQTQELLAGYPIGEADTLVDVGCGEGEASEFAARCGAAVYAVDIDPRAVAAVERRMSRRKTTHPVRALLSDANPLPLPDRIATRVVAQEVMEHVDDPRQFLRELVRIGKPDARYLLSVPDPAAESLHKILAPSAYWGKPNHLRIIGRDEFDCLVREAGLTIDKRVSYSFFWAMWWLLLWSSEGSFAFGSPGTPVLSHWNKMWTALLKTPNGLRIKQALDEFMPKSQVLIARKAA